MIVDKATISALLEKLLWGKGEPIDYRQLEQLLQAGMHDAQILEVLQELGERVRPSPHYDPEAMEAVIQRIVASTGRLNDLVDQHDSGQHDSGQRDSSRQSDFNRQTGRSRESDLHHQIDFNQEIDLTHQNDPHHENDRKRRGIVRSLKRWSWAAAVLVCCAGIVFWFDSGREKAPALAQHNEMLEPAIVPGSDGATLVLDDGTEIVLDSLGNGLVATQQGARAELVDGRLTYRAIGNDMEAVAFNTMRTPRGRQFQMQLPDGSKVWLNAGSSIRYPTRFLGPERRVALTGEAYFEVARNPAQPFSVQVDSLEIKVLGTHFNVNAYDDERAVRTTLLEGSVEISRGNNSEKLVPGQQGIMSRQTGGLQVKKTDTEQVMAWKNGLFQFDKADIKTIMRQISRWYDVEVLYTEELPDRVFDGKISRSAQLSEVLGILEFSEVKFSVEGNRILVK